MIEPGTLLQNRYRVVKQIGQGGMGAVYIATDERFHSTVAIKQTFFDDPALRRAFEREAQLLNHLRHGALPKVSDHFVEGDGQFLIMEFIEGADLSDLLEQRDGAFPVGEVLQWADELLNALDYLHTHEPPIIHRDIKPQNLKLTARGQIVLLDFGLAKGAAAQTNTSLTASVYGYSRNYAPLEQIQGTGTDARSDLYSLAATLYHLLTGKVPVDALTRASAVVNHQPDPLRPANLVNAQVPEAVGRIIQRAMAQKATLRPSAAAEMRAALRQAWAASPLARQAPAAASPTSQSATYEISLSDLSVQSASNRPDTGQARPSAAHLDETTVVDATSHVTRQQIRPYVAPTAPAPPEQPARSSTKLLVVAVVALLIACVAVPFVLRHNSSSAPAKSETQTTDPASATTDGPANASSTTQTPSIGGTPSGLSSTEAAPLQTQAPTAHSGST